MLFQSDEQNLYLLPALPAQKWRDGLVAGLRGRGAVTLGIRWFGGHLDEVTIQVSKFCNYLQETSEAWMIFTFNNWK